MFRFRFPHFSRKWKWPKVLIVLMVIELAGTIPALALFGIASPDLYRTNLWAVGYANGFNSDPKQILYAYANYRPLPKTPFVWSQTLTDYNVAVSVLSMFVLLVKCSMFILHIWWPILGTVSNLAIVVLWTVSLYGQMGPDHSDPRYPSNIAWYISKSCSYARPSGNYGYCRQAKAAFAVSLIMLVVFLLNFLLGVYSLIPTASQRAANKIGIDDMQSKHSPLADSISVEVSGVT
jgi:ABC-type proline/glycine betaine transport system permease subunit